MLDYIQSESTKYVTQYLCLFPHLKNSSNNHIYIHTSQGWEEYMIYKVLETAWNIRSTTTTIISFLFFPGPVQLQLYPPSLHCPQMDTTTSLLPPGDGIHGDHRKAALGMHL